MRPIRIEADIDAPAEAVKEMERQLSINEDVLRYLTVRVDELDLELSPILARRDRDRERRDELPEKQVLPGRSAGRHGSWPDL